MKRSFEIDETLADLLPALTDDEREGLEEQIAQRKHIEALVILILDDTGRRVLGDGHNRLEIADKLKLPYPTREIHVADLNAAVDWVVAHQLARRNLTPQMRAYYRGKEYLSQKRPHGGPQEPSGHDAHLPNTAEELAEKHGVDERTIRKDAKFSEGVDALPPEARAKVLKGEATATKPEISTGIFCPRCTRVGPIKGCPVCEQKREKARLREEKKRAPKPKKKKKKPEWPAFDGLVGKLHKLMTERGVPVTIREKFLSSIDEVRKWQKSQSTG